ncbi:MAG: transaldolase family protein, partial [Candidatus Omnitrophota bacterium]
MCLAGDTPSWGSKTYRRDWLEFVQAKQEGRVAQGLIAGVPPNSGDEWGVEGLTWNRDRKICMINHRYEDKRLVVIGPLNKNGVLGFESFSCEVRAILENPVNDNVAVLFHAEQDNYIRNEHPVLMVFNWDKFIKAAKSRTDYRQSMAHVIVNHLLRTAINNSETAVEDVIGCLVLRKAMAFEWSFNGRKLILLGADGNLIEWDIDNQTYNASYLPFVKQSSLTPDWPAIVMSPGGIFAAVSYQRGILITDEQGEAQRTRPFIEIWDVRARKVVARLDDIVALQIAWDMEGNVVFLKRDDIATYSDEGIFRWRWSSNEPPKLIKELKNFTVLSQALSPNGRFIAAGNDYGQIIIIDLENIDTEYEVFPLASHSVKYLEDLKPTQEPVLIAGWVTSIVWSPDSLYIATGQLGRITFWKVESRKIEGVKNLKSLPAASSPLTLAPRELIKGNHSLLRIYYELNGLPSNTAAYDGIPPDLARLLEVLDLGGVDLTTNPVIFQGKVTSGQLDERITELLKEGKTPVEIYNILYNEVAKWAIQEFTKYYNLFPHQGRAVSREHSALLTQSPAIIREILEIVAFLGPTCFIKIANIPGAIDTARAVISQLKVNMNATLVFSDMHYVDMVEGYILGLEELVGSLHAKGVSEEKIRQVLSLIYSWNSVFTRRIDDATYPLIDKAIAQAEASENLELVQLLKLIRFKVALANDKLIYRIFKTIFLNQPFSDSYQLYAQDQQFIQRILRLQSKFNTLKELGANPQRILIASSEPKSDYPVSLLLYVLGLLGLAMHFTLPDKSFRGLSSFIFQLSDAEIASLIINRQIVEEPLPRIIQTADNKAEWDRAVLLTPQQREARGIGNITADEVISIHAQHVLKPAGLTLRDVAEERRAAGVGDFVKAEETSIKLITGKCEQLASSPAEKSNAVKIMFYLAGGLGTILLFNLTVAGGKQAVFLGSAEAALTVTLLSISSIIG